MDSKRIAQDDRESFSLWYASQMEKQGRACAICRRPFEDTKATEPMVDHDARHCGPRNHCAVCRRGLLCMRCNNGIGLFGENTESMARAIAYLDSSPVDLSQPGYTRCWGRRQTWEYRADLKMDLDKAQQMRELRAAGLSRKQLAALFGVSVATVKSVTSGKSWREPA